MDQNPVVMTKAGEIYGFRSRINAIVWEGATTSGDTVELIDPITKYPLWAGRTSDTQTYLGVNLGERGTPAPNGFILNQISSGRLFVYIRED